MLTLAKALIGDPDLLVLDEISDGLQPSVVTDVAEVLNWMREERGPTILMVSRISTSASPSPTGSPF